MINCSLIGIGNWGKNIYRVLEEDNNFSIKFICRNKNIDKDISNKIKIVTNYKEAINNEVKAVFIATPSETHFEIAKYALENNKNVFIEKPICFTESEYKILKKISHKKSLILHVNYIHIFNDNFKELKKNYNKKNNEATTIKIILGNNGPIREKTPMLMDWAPHIFSMLH